MDGLQLYVLGRRLMRIADASFERAGAAPPPLGLMLVLEDIATHPDSSIGEITARTGLPQSHVSTSVARFAARGLVETASDPSDGRRTLVRVTAAYLERASHRGAGSVDDAVAAALDQAEHDAVAEVIATLDWLAERLVPDVRGHMARAAARSRTAKKKA